ncbi:MAG TPA: hypothetical protein VM099_15445 [Gemmatimonadaceae bacterium]|nr:hypothetical protein [Gemmatimonadaceae bacterium]
MKSRFARGGLRAAVLTGMCVALSAHVGSPDAWYEGNAGPYKITVQVQLAGVVPGVAQIFVRVPGEKVDRVTLLANKFDATGGAPPPEQALPDEADPALYAGKLWLMSGGSNSITVDVSGPKGNGKAIVPVVNVALRRLKFDPKMGLGLGAVGLFLFVGLVTIIGAAVRESTTAPGAAPPSKNRFRARVAMSGTAIFLALLLFGGWSWWNSEDANFNRTMFKPFAANARINETAEGEELVFTIENPAWIHRRDSAWLSKNGGNAWTPLIADHGKLMHLFLIKDDMSAFAHVHPMTVDSVRFFRRLRDVNLPRGRYRVFADIVHESGYAQTLVTTVDKKYDGGPKPSWTDQDESSFIGIPNRGAAIATLADSSTLRIHRENSPVIAGREAGLRFDVLDKEGRPAILEPFLGMAGHAVVASGDGSVFVHLHPSGTVSMASQMAFQMRQPGDTIAGRLAKRLSTAEYSAMNHATVAGNEVSFPYAFPKPGNYMVWVQVKRGGRVLTGAFPFAVASGVKSAH